MSELSAFGVLAAEDPPGEDLLAALEVVAAVPVADRWPFLAAALRWARHPASPVRIAVLRCLAGATGLPAERAILEALGEGEPAVRAAALAALPGLCAGQPAAWLHAVASPHADVRRAAAQATPDLAQPTWIRLLADPEARPLVVARLERGLLPQAARALLQHLHEGELPPPAAAAALATLPWRDDLPGVLAAIGTTRTITDKELAGATDTDLAESILARTDALDRLVHALLFHGGQPLGPALQVFSVLLDRLVARELNPASAMGLATAVIAVMMGDDLRPHPVVVAFAAAFRPALLAWPELSLDLRREAAATLAGLSHRPTGPADFAAMGGGALLALPDWLPVACGLVALGKAGTLAAVVEARGVSAAVEAVVAQPELGAILLRRDHEAPDDTEAARLLRLAMERGAAAGPLVGRLLVHAPSRTVAALSRTAGADLLAGAVVQADALLAERGNGAVEAAELAVALCARLARPVRALSRVLRDSEAQGPLVQQLVMKVLAQTDAPTVVASLHTAGMSRLAALDLAHQLLTVSVVLPFAKACTARTPELDAWLAPVRPPEPDPLLVVPPPGRRGPAGRALVAALARAEEQSLDGVIEPALAAPRTGLCPPLAARLHPDGPHPRVCAALLLSDDPLDQVAAQLDRFSRRDPACLRDLDRLMVAAYSRREALGPAALLWLHRWPVPGAALRALAEGEGVLLDLLRTSLSWQGAALRGAAWQAVRSVLSHWRWHAPARARAAATDALVALAVEVLTDRGAAGRGPLGFPLDAVDRETVQRAAAELLVALHGAGRDLGPWRDDIALATAGLSPGTISVLGGLLPWRLPERPRRRIALSTPPVADLPTLVEVCTEPGELALLLATEAPGVAELAALRLLELGQAGAAVLVDALLAGGPHLHLLAGTLPHLPDGPALDRLRAVAGSAEVDPDLRLSVALGLCERGEEHLEDAVAAALAGAISTPAQCAALLPPERGGLAHRLWAAPDPDIASRAVELLAQELIARLDETPRWERDPDDPCSRALRGFLLLGGDHPNGARLAAARALLATDDALGAPLLVADAMREARQRGAEAAGQWARFLREGPLLDLVQAGLVVGAPVVPIAALVGGLLDPMVDVAGREAAALAVLRDCRDPAEQSRVAPLLWLRRGRLAGTLRIADLFLWGRSQSRRLLGRTLGVEMLAGDDLGWTRLDEPVIRVNPLPVLRGERDGAAIVRGLLVHELGHHLYNADPDGIACAKQAHAEGIGRLHNLVCDEHLERNLRTIDAGYGDDLKRLGAWAFQHANRRVQAELLVARLGPRTVPVLMRSSLGPARQSGCVTVGLGRLLSALEAHGSSFGRFVRALRMGLGNRYGDPKVEEALALFRVEGSDRPFRYLDNAGLLALTRELRRIFGEETGVLDVCDLHGTAEPGEGDVLADGGGVSARDVQREVDRAERRAERKKQGEGDGARRGGGPDVYSTGPGTAFDRIERVKVLAFDPAAHKALAQDVVRPARQLREVLARLGLSTVVVKPRISGHRLDRSRLSALALRRDPRVLVARRRIMDSDLFIGVVVDCSGSMSGGRMERARRFAALLAEACKGLPGVDLRLFGFTDKVIYDAGTAARPAAHALVANGGNNDAAGLHHAAGEALRSKRSARLLIMISDGLPTECTVEALTNLVQQLERRHGMACAQVAVHPLHKRCFTDYIEVLSSDVSVAVRDFGRVVQRLVLRTMRG